MGVKKATDMAEVITETKEEARARFYQNYLDLAINPSADWFNDHVDALVRIALHYPPADRPRLPKIDRSELLPWGREPFAA